MYIDEYNIYYLTKPWKDGKKQKNFECSSHIGSEKGNVKEIKKIIPLAEQFIETNADYNSRIVLTIEVFEE